MKSSRTKAPPPNHVKEFREKLKAWRIAELARRAGVSAQVVSKAEKGLPISRPSELKIAKALDKSHEEVFPGAD